MNNNYEIAINTEHMNKPAKSPTTEMVVSRQAQEVQAAMIIAQRFPRDEIDAYNRIMTSCSRKTLAKDAMYEYPRGGQKITGPSIRLAEELARNWGNLDFGIIELEQKNGESSLMAYCWDLETNTRQTKIFTVKHERKANKKIKALDDPRDIYEHTANYGARRLRACILGIIPGDIVEAAVEKCEETLRSGNKEPLVDRVRKMVETFDEKFSVSKDMLEKYVGCDVKAFTERDIIRLGKIYTSLKDGMAKREDYFELPKPKSQVEEEFSQMLNADATEKEFEGKDPDNKLFDGGGDE